VLAAASLLSVAPAAATESPDRPAAVVAMGDALLSGAGARWAGNSAAGPDAVDALGDAAYTDEGCLRSSAAAVSESEPLGVPGLTGVNLACAGASAADVAVQATELRGVMADYDIRLVLLSVGRNDMGLADAFVSCAGTYLTGQSGTPGCAETEHVAQRFTEERRDDVAADVGAAVAAVSRVLTQAGSEADIVLVTQPRVLPADGLRFSDGGVSRTSLGYCPFTDEDAAFLMDTAIGSLNGAIADAAQRDGLTVLDLGQSVDAHELCAEDGQRVGGTEIGTWTEPGAADELEWVRDYRVADSPPWLARESMQLNYWGHRAVRACIREFWLSGAEESASCTPAGGLNPAGEPAMSMESLAVEAVSEASSES
jgi:hypothetical protein